MKTLAGRRALVTGGSRGIGAATALLFAEWGVNVVIGYRARERDATAVVEILLSDCGCARINDIRRVGQTSIHRKAHFTKPSECKVFGHGQVLRYVDEHPFVTFPIGEICDRQVDQYWDW